MATKWRYESQYKQNQRVQTQAMGFMSQITGGVITGFDEDGYPMVKWDDGEYEGESWLDTDLDPESK